MLRRLIFYSGRRIPHALVPMTQEPELPGPPCSICGGARYRGGHVLWPDLVNAWGLSPEEVRYIDRQQGTVCAGCGANLRSIALARAVALALGMPEPLNGAIDRAPSDLRSLEINDAGTLSPLLGRLPRHLRAAYPAVDMMAMPYGAGLFDLVVHSDTLEHVADPLQALSECRRVLKSGGALCMTVPIVVGRLTRSRAGLPPSYHGFASNAQPDLLVHSEFGADAWTSPIRAGFSRVEMVAFEYPGALALTCRA
jgi:SAM-dependent methyltransferase